MAATSVTPDSITLDWVTPRTEIVELTTPLILAMLERGKHKNRDSSKTWVKAMSERMYADKWPDTGDTIAFDTNGDLNNGHQRLQAAFMALSRPGSARIFNRLAFGVAPKAFIYTDNVRSRKLHDKLKTNGVPHSNILARGGLSLVLNYLLPCKPNGDLQHARFSDEDQLRFAKEHPEIDASALYAENLYLAIGLPVAIGVSLHFLGTRSGMDLPKTTEFFDAVVSGKGLTSDTDPRLVFRNWAARGQTIPASRRLKPRKVFQAGLAALRVFIENESLDELRIKKGPWCPRLAAAEDDVDAAVVAKAKLAKRVAAAKRARAKRATNTDSGADNGR